MTQDQMSVAVAPAPSRKWEIRLEPTPRGEQQGWRWNVRQLYYSHLSPTRNYGGFSVDRRTAMETAERKVRDLLRIESETLCYEYDGGGEDE